MNRLEPHEKRLYDWIHDHLLACCDDPGHCGACPMLDFRRMVNDKRLLHDTASALTARLIGVQEKQHD